MMYKNDYIWISSSDSRNPEERQQNTGMMHTNDIRTWIKYKGTWYQCASRGCIIYMSIFLDCKTEEDYDWVFNCLLQENEIYTNDG